jgi:DNA-binding MarR family transcriptional regulator
VSETFIKLPSQALADDRLSHRELRVLMALYSHGANPGDVVWPSRDVICKLTRIKPPHVSVAISRLIELGWIERKQCGHQPNQYTLKLPEITESVIPEKNAEVTKSVRRGYQIGTSEVTDSVLHRTDQEQTKNRPTIVGDARASKTENKQPSGATEGGDGPHNGEHAKQAKRKASTKVPMPDDWMPDADLWDDIAKLAIGRGFAESLVPEFRRYWREDRAGEKRPGWNRTFLAHVQRNWTREKERHKGGTNVTPLRPVPSGHRNGGGNFRTFEQMRADNTQRAIDEFLFGDNVGTVIDA